MTPIAGRPGFLLLEDGTPFRGTYHGNPRSAEAAAEVVFTTNMTGYQEVLTDPSYRGQIVTMTAPLIGNCGVNAEDAESARAQVAGLVVRELSPTPSNWRATESLAAWLAEAGVPVLADVDTRRLTRHLRSSGVMRGVLAAGDDPGVGWAAAALAACPAMEGLDLASAASTREAYSWGDQAAAHHVVAYDFGIKRDILQLLSRDCCRVTVVPAATPAEAVLELEPDGVFLSNGPGDPAAVARAPEMVRAIAERGVPILGICLGHQLIGLAYGGRTEKLPYGHRGGNHPVRDMASGQVLITSQNHGFAVSGSEAGVPGAPALAVTHVNLNDGTVEGLRHREHAVFAVQYHPEAAPGPHDARPIFSDFLAALRSRAPAKWGARAAPPA